MCKTICFLSATLLLVGCASYHGAAPAYADAAHDSANAPVQISINPSAAGVQIPQEFSGASFEQSRVLAGRDGSHFFDAQDKEMVGMFRGLGLKSLRVGGNSLDSATGNGATDADIDALYGFAKAAEIRIIYSVRMKGVETDAQIADDVRQVKYIWSKYADLTESVAIGNEPNIYFADSAPGGVGTAPAGAATMPLKTAVLGGVGDSGAVGIGYAAYKKRWEKIAGAIVQEVPEVRLCGPSSTPGKVAWAGAFARDEGHGRLAGNLAMVTQHSYPGGNAQKVADVGAGRELILSGKMEENYEKFYSTFGTACVAAGKPFRLEESNSLFHGGAANLSNSAASALWGLDFMWWWASHGAAGVNFHTGMNETAEGRVPGGYDLFWSTPSGIKVHPMGYAVKAFEVGGGGGGAGGKSLPITLHDGGLNVTAYAAENGGNVFLTVINRENVKGNSAAGARDATVRVDVGNGDWKMEILFLRGPKEGLSGLTGMTLGGAQVDKDGKWEGKWEAVESGNGKCEVQVPAGSVGILRMSR